MRISFQINLPQQRCRSWLRELGIRSHAELFANVLDGTGIVVDNFAVFVHSLQKRRYKGGQKKLSTLVQCSICFNEKIIIGAPL